MANESVDDLEVPLFPRPSDNIPKPGFFTKLFNRRKTAEPQPELAVPSVVPPQEESKALEVVLPQIKMLEINSQALKKEAKKKAKKQEIKPPLDAKQAALQTKIKSFDEELSSINTDIAKLNDELTKTKV
ncbi:MAG: hypothetical protein V1837_04370 [Candidatus Woesearchaeota archaeon]